MIVNRLPPAMLPAAFVNPTCFNQHIQRQRWVESVREDSSAVVRMDLPNMYLEQGGKLSGKKKKRAVATSKNSRRFYLWASMLALAFGESFLGK